MTVVMVDVPWVPCIMLSRRRRSGDVKIGRSSRHRQRDRSCLLDPTAIARDGDGITYPPCVLAPTLMVMVELPEPGAGIGVGLKVTVVPAGNARS